MIDFDLPEEKAYSARINRKTLMDIKKGIHNYIIVGRRYRNMKYTAAQLAADIGVNTRYLSAALRLHYGCNYAELVNKMRIDEAKQMMMTPGCELTMEDLALSVGFATRQSFYNAFSKFVGMKPTEWREQQIEQKRQEEEQERQARRAASSFTGLMFD